MLFQPFGCYVRIQRRHDSHACCGNLRRDARTLYVARCHVAMVAAAGYKHRFGAIQNGQISDLIGAIVDALQIRLHQSWETCGLQIGMPELENARHQPKQLAIGSGIANVHKCFEVTACGGTRHVATLASLGRGQARVVGIKGFDDGQAFFKAGNPVLAV